MPFSSTVQLSGVRRYPFLQRYLDISGTAEVYPMYNSFGTTDDQKAAAKTTTTATVSNNNSIGRSRGVSERCRISVVEGNVDQLPARFAKFRPLAQKQTPRRRRRGRM